MSSQDRQIFRRHEDLYGSGFSGRSFDEANAFKIFDHPVDRWRRDLEVALHVGFRGRFIVDAAVGMDKCEILALLFSESGLTIGVTRAGRLIHQSFFQQGEPDEHTIPCRIEPMRA